MKETDKTLVSDFFYLKTISEKQFLTDYSGNVSDGSKHFANLLNDALLSKSNDDLEAAMMVGGYFKLWDKNLVPILNQLLLENWHFQHENIVSDLQIAKDPRSVEAIYLTALKQFEYLSYDDAFGLARKCIWALADINTPEAIDKLKLLSQSGNTFIKSYADKRLASL